MARCFIFERHTATAAAMRASVSRIPAVQNTQSHGFGTATGGLIGRMSFVLATVCGGAGGGIRMPEFEAMLDATRQR